MLRKMLTTRQITSRVKKRQIHHFTNYVKELTQRNLLANSYPSDLRKKFSDELSSLPPVAYAGFDPTAESLHVGNLLVLSNLLRCQQFGIQPIALIGGATTRIGDPSGRNSERNTVQEDVVESNARSITSQIETIFSHASTSKLSPIVVNNYEWFGKMSMIEFLRNCKRMQVGVMLRMGAIKSRMENDSGISFTEFSYQTMQAYDWLVLSEKFDCRFQLGGSDQLGHLDFGAHHIKKTTNKFAAGVCLPLLTDSAGNKLGKSVGGGSLWLDPKKTSPYHFYQFFAQLHDDQAVKLLLQLSLKPFVEVQKIIEEHQKNLGKWVAQKELAKEVTKLVHGVEGLDMAERCTQALFGSKSANLSNLNRDEIVQLFGTTLEIRLDQVQNIGEIADKTRNDKVQGHILMQKGAFSINGVKKINPLERPENYAIRLPNATDLGLICWGKRKYQLIRWI